MKALLINGVNLNLLGQREPDIYGNETLSDIVSQLKSQAKYWKIELEAFHSNAEYKIIERIHLAAQEKPTVDWIMINAGAYTHTSIAIRDALLGVNIPFIEVHLSNTRSREAFRHHSYLSDIAEGVVEGFGKHSYFLALYSIYLKHNQTN